MLKSKIRTQEETEKYLRELKTRLDEMKNAPVEKMTDFFTSRIDHYNDVHKDKWGEEYAHIADFFDDDLGTLLDIGCGTGLELESIYRRFPDVKVTGIDLSEAMLNKLRETYRGKDIELINGDYSEYEFEQGKFDAAMSFLALHYFRYERKQLIYHQLYRALKPGGYYIECDTMACCNEEEALYLEGYEYRRKQNNIPEDVLMHINIPLTLEHQHELLKNAGFRKVEVLHQNGSLVIIRADK